MRDLLLSALCSQELASIPASSSGGGSKPRPWKLGVKGAAGERILDPTHLGVSVYSEFRRIFPRETEFIASYIELPTPPSAEEGVGPLELSSKSGCPRRSPAARDATACASPRLTAHSESDEEAISFSGNATITAISCVEYAVPGGGCCVSSTVASPPPATDAAARRRPARAPPPTALVAELRHAYRLEYEVLQ